jgi:hypothetical protein
MKILEYMTLIYRVRYLYFEMILGLCLRRPSVSALASSPLHYPLQPALYHHDVLRLMIVEMDQEADLRRIQ